MVQQSPPALLTPAQAAAALNVSVRTLKLWSQTGKLEAVELPSGHARYRRADIERIAGVAS